MKKLLLVAALLALNTSVAHAYLTLAGADPVSTPDAEYKSAQKSVTDGVSDAIVAAGELLTYDVANTAANAYSVTRVGLLPSTVLGSLLVAGVATKPVATGDTGYFLIQTRGYATVKYDSTVGVSNGAGGGIKKGDRLCANAVGAAVACSSAASGSKVIALEDKASGTGTSLKVLLSCD